MWEQFALVADLQRNWSDNSVSATVTFSEQEAPQIPRALEAFEDKIKSISLLPLTDHGYEQAPYIEISKDKYENLQKNISPLSFTGFTHEEDEKFCDSDVCTL